MRCSFFYALIGCIFLFGCSQINPEQISLHPSAFAEMDGWEQLSHKPAFKAFLRSCTKLEKQPDDRVIKPTETTIADWKPVCVAAKTYAGEPRAFFEQYFEPHTVTSWGDDEGLFTGYYEIALHGSLERSERYRYPIYAVPKDFKKPYLSRADIETQGLDGKADVLVWVEDPVRLFFLHIQGSGRVILPDGSAIRVGYAEQNGFEYIAIGAVMRDRGLLPREKLSAPNLMAWLSAHPKEAEAIMRENPSYIFFRKVDGQDGPIGAQNVPLISTAAIAVDRFLYSYGIPVWLETTLPDPYATPFRTLLIAQDTGGAIRGPIRGDVFFGYGEFAEHDAGHMKQRGRITLLLPKRNHAE